MRAIIERLKDGEEVSLADVFKSGSKISSLLDASKETGRRLYISARFGTARLLPMGRRHPAIILPPPPRGEGPTYV